MKGLEAFTAYLNKERKMAATSLRAYRGDVEEFLLYLKEKGKEGKDLVHTDVIGFLFHLKTLGRSAATINRKLASLRAYVGFLMEEGLLAEDVTLGIKSPRVPRKKIDYLTIQEVERLLAQPDQSAKGIRDLALMELMYASGMRVSEVAQARLSDLNLRVGLITCSGEHGKARVIPLGRPARSALEVYVYEGRKALLRDREDGGALFLNYQGQSISRQGVWKILKEYGRAAELESTLSPQVLRNSFAVHMVQNGADLKSLQELLGHEDPAATQILMAVSKNRIMDVYDKTHPRA